MLEPKVGRATPDAVYIAYETEIATDNTATRTVRRIAEIDEIDEIDEIGAGYIFNLNSDGLQNTTAIVNYFSRNESAKRRCKSDKQHGMRTVHIGSHDYFSQ